MTKVRVHELAKELGMENKELLDLLQKKNIDVKNHMSTLEEDVAGENPQGESRQAGKKRGKSRGRLCCRSSGKSGRSSQEEKPGLRNPSSELQKQQQNSGKPPESAEPAPGSGRSQTVC